MARKKKKKKSGKKTSSKKKSSKKKRQYLKSPRIRIRVVGVGGGAASILEEMSKTLKKPTYLVADTDERTFKKKSSKIRTLPFGEEITKGWGTGMNPEMGKKAALEEKEKIKKKLEGVDFVILVSCLGGGVGSGATPVFAEALKELKILSMGVFTLPFEFEGEKKMKVAKDSLEELEKYLSGFLVLPNEEILKRSEKKAPLQDSLSSMNSVLTDYLAELISTISTAGIINIDFADVRNILDGKGQKLSFGKGIGSGPDRAEEAIRSLFENPFFNSSLKMKKILFNVSGGSDIRVKEVEAAAGSVAKINPNAKIIFGISQKSKSRPNIKITLLGVGEEKESSSKSEKKKKTKSKKATKKRGRPKKKSSKKRKKKTSRSKKSSKGSEKKKKTSKKSSSKKETKSDKKPKSSRKRKVRKSALEVKREKEKSEEEELAKEPEWEVPAFLRKKLE